MDQSIPKEVKNFLEKIEKNLGYQLSKTDRLEILDSLIHLGKAIDLFYHQGRESNDPTKES